MSLFVKQIIKKIGSFLSAVLDKKVIELARLKRVKEKKCQRVLRQILTNSIFLIVIILNCYVNKTQNAYNYHNHIKTMFASYQDVCTKISVLANFISIALFYSFLFLKLNNVQDFFSWISKDFLKNSQADKLLSNITMDSYLNDASSIVIGYPILRQLRIKNGISLIFF